MKKENILQTLFYFDQYDFPLTKEELEKWEINDKSYNGYKNYKDYKHYNGYYFLSGREEIVGLRKRREEESQRKWPKAYRVANLLKLIPTIKFIGVSGSLAVNNASVDDDIDLFLVTQSGWLWTTRFFVNLLLDLFGQRRRPQNQGKICRDKFCLNMWCDENHLAAPAERAPQDFQNLHFAMDLLLLKPILDRDKIQQKLFSANQWAKKFVKMENKSLKLPKLLKKTKTNPLEKFFFKFQIWWMGRGRPDVHRTAAIGPGRAWFWTNKNK